jgi:hypothetical protein
LDSAVRGSGRSVLPASIRYWQQVPSPTTLNSCGSSPAGEMGFGCGQGKGEGTGSWGQLAAQVAVLAALPGTLHTAPWTALPSPACLPASHGPHLAGIGTVPRCGLDGWLPARCPPALTFPTATATASSRGRPPPPAGTCHRR